MKSGTHLVSTGNDALVQQSTIDISEPIDELLVEKPARSLNTYIFIIDQGSAAIKNFTQPVFEMPKTYYDLGGRRLSSPRGLCIERRADGASRKVYIDN